MSKANSGLSRSQRWTLVVACMSVTVVIASMSALYTALPDITSSTGATQAELTWVVDGYTLALACLVLPAGALGDRFGRRAALIAGLTIFAGASIVPAVVHETGWLIGARVVAGIGAALVMPSTLSLLTAGFPSDRRGAAVGIWAGVAGSGAVAGILGSGLLLEYCSWPTIFVCLSAAGAGLLIAALSIPESIDRQRAAFDAKGAIAAATAIGLFVVGLVEGPVRGWSDPLVLIALIGAALLAVLFVWVERRATHPMLDLALFTNRAFGSATLTIVLQFLVTFGAFLLLVQYLQLILGYSALAAAGAIAPVAIPLVGISLLATSIASRVGLRAMNVSGLLVIALSLYLVSRLQSTSGYLDVCVLMMVMGAGIGLCTAPSTEAIVVNTPSDKQGLAAAVNDAAREIGAAIGIAIAGSVLAAGYANRIDPVLAQIPAAARIPVSNSLAAALEVADHAGPQGVQLTRYATAAFIHGAHNAALILAVITAVSAVIIAVWAPTRRTRPTAGRALTTPTNTVRT